MLISRLTFSARVTCSYLPAAADHGTADLGGAALRGQVMHALPGALARPRSERKDAKVWNFAGTTLSGGPAG